MNTKQRIWKHRAFGSYSKLLLNHSATIGNGKQVIPARYYRMPRNTYKKGLAFVPIFMYQIRK